MKVKFLGSKDKIKSVLGQIKPKFGKMRWLSIGLTVSLICALLLTVLYTTFRTGSANEDYTLYEQQDKIEQLTEVTYVLYHDLYNKLNSTNADYYEIYLQPKEGYEALFDLSSSGRWEVGETEDVTPSEDVVLAFATDELTEEEELALEELYNHQAVMINYFGGLEHYFDNVNSTYDYWIEDVESGTYISNISKDVKNYYEKGISIFV